MEKVFLANGFSRKIVEKPLHSPCPPTPPTPPPPPSNDDPHKSTTKEQWILCPLYIHQLSEKIEKVCAPLGIKAAFKPTNTMRQSLVHVKKIPQEKRDL